MYGYLTVGTQGTLSPYVMFVTLPMYLTLHGGSSYHVDAGINPLPLGYYFFLFIDHGGADNATRWSSTADKIFYLAAGVLALTLALTLTFSDAVYCTLLVLVGFSGMRILASCDLPTVPPTGALQI